MTATTSGASQGTAGTVPRLGPVRFLTIAAIGTIWPLTMDLYLPAFPQMRADLGTTAAGVQLTLTGAFLGMALGQLTAGPVSDRVGRSRPLCAALALYFLASVGCAASPTVETLVIGRLLQGMGAAAASVIVTAMLRDLASGPALVRRGARLSLLTGVVGVASPSLGAELLRLTDWRGLFWVLVAYGGALVAAALLALLPRETHPPHRRAERHGARLRDDLGALVRDRRYRATVAGAGLVWAAMMGYMASSAFLFQEAYELGPRGYAAVFGGHGVVMMVGAQVSARLAGGRDLHRLFRGSVLALAGSALLLTASVLLLPGLALAGFVGPLLLFTTALGVMMPLLHATALHDHGLRAGTAAAHRVRADGLRGPGRPRRRSARRRPAAHGRPLDARRHRPGRRRRTPLIACRRPAAPRAPRAPPPKC